METFLLISVIILLVNEIWRMITINTDVPTSRKIEHLIDEIRMLDASLLRVEKQIFILNSTRHSEYKENTGEN